MFKKILNAINPVNWVQSGIRRKVIRFAIDYLESFIMRKVRYMPIRDYLVRIALRIEELLPFVLSGKPVDAALRDYWEKNKPELLKDQITIIRAIVASEVNDPELVAKIDRFAGDMQEYLERKV